MIDKIWSNSIRAKKLKDMFCRVKKPWYENLDKTTWLSSIFRKDKIILRRVQISTESIFMIHKTFILLIVNSSPKSKMFSSTKISSFWSFVTKKMKEWYYSWLKETILSKFKLSSKGLSTPRPIDLLRIKTVKKVYSPKFQDFTVTPCMLKVSFLTQSNSIFWLSGLLNHHMWLENT